jgi:hypothetical protein
MKNKHSLARGDNTAIISSWNVMAEYKMTLSDKLVISEPPTAYYYPWMYLKFIFNITLSVQKFEF